MFKKIFYKIIGIYQVLKDSPSYNSFSNYSDYILNIQKTMVLNGSSDTVSLDLGCGSEIKNPFSAKSLWGVDISHSVTNENVKLANLSIEPIPFSSQYFDFVTAHDFLEHVPRYLLVPHLICKSNLPPELDLHGRFPFVELMNEVYRVLKPGGYFLSVTPAFPFSIAFTDPTHINYINEHTFENYFSTRTIGKIYGFNGKFELIRQGWRGRYLISLMRRPL